MRGDLTAGARDHKIGIDVKFVPARRPDQVAAATAPRSLHAIKCLLQKLEVAGISHFLPRALDPFFLQRILGRTIALIKDAEDAGEWELREFVGSELVSDVVAQLVLGSVVPFLFLDHFEATALARIGRIERSE